ncbi:MAG: EAL domain-containing protein [Pseudomonadota bacterium]|nr:EAL domain-containing protein [Pseudomonadota bacterium]
MMNYLPSSYDPTMVVASVLIGSFASYVALDLAKRSRTREHFVAVGWWTCGSIAMGTGIWSMHFLGMLAFSLPIALGYAKLLTFLSWLAAVAVCAMALAVASRGSLTMPRLGIGSLLMGAGVCAMHYIGMAALTITPGIVWNPWLIGASVAIAVGASAAALVIFFWLRRASLHRGWLYQPAAALVMGLAISGMHYTAMAAASFPLDAVCLSAASLAGGYLGNLVAVLSVALLALTLLASTLDAQRRLGKSLHVANDELRKQAYLDPLTGLANRALFDDRLRHAVARYERGGTRTGGSNPERLAILLLDLDGFKPVNDSFGHSVGDLLLQEVATRLKGVVRESDTLARLGGDEFVLLVEGAASKADSVQLARRILEALAQPFDLPGQQISISGSVGIVFFPDHGEKDKLVTHADAAMYIAKRSGGNTYVLFEPHMDGGPQEQLTIRNDLRHAIEFGQLQLFYQPKVFGEGLRISGVEALLRWNHPRTGMVSPNDFIPIAERFGLINSLGNWVINEACRQIRAWADESVHMQVAINLSVYQLREEGLTERIGEALRRHRVDGSQLLCEITESVAMEDVAATQRTFEGLASIGVFLSIDDFGTGYSSLSYLRQLPASQLKIDRSFVNDLDSCPDARAVVDAVIRLAHALGLKVVAEGVETAAQRDILRKLGCDELQGFLFAKPMPADALLAWRAAHESSGAMNARTARPASLNTDVAAREERAALAAASS